MLNINYRNMPEAIYNTRGIPVLYMQYRGKGRGIRTCSMRALGRGSETPLASGFHISQR